jgi:ribosome biogenesis GTPase
MPFSPELPAFGWTAFFQSQLSIEEMEQTTPVRVAAVHRGAWDVIHPDFARRLSPLPAMAKETDVTVGDWLLLDAASDTMRRVLERQSLFQRRAAGTEAKMQLMAANVDSVFIVSSCNDDFNTARLERYLVVSQSAGATPVVILTKMDMVEDASSYKTAAEGLFPGLIVECVDARADAARSILAPWCCTGQTVALLGSSGVGKSTLVNTLSGGQQQTAAIREDDAKGRHTTTGRSLHRLATGGWLIDTPGMRELQLAGVEEGLDAVFRDIEDLSAHCRFSDCTHQTEPGCAVRAAIESGALESARLERYRKLIAEDRYNSQTVAERRARDKAFGNLIKSVNKEMKRRGKR